MEVMEILDLRKAFLPSKDRYIYPHAEAMRLRRLWTFERQPGRSRDAQMITELLTKAKGFIVEGNQDFSKALSLIKKGLLINPRYHFFYALRGDICSSQGKFDEAVKNYEDARRMIKFDKKLLSTQGKNYYSRSLIDAYWKKGLHNQANDRLLEAVSDYEQILALRPFGVIVTEVQDKLLDTLRAMNKYEAYRYNWSRFMHNVDSTRASILLTQYAEYKIFRREMESARHILSEAIDLDGENEKARQLLQVVYNTGHHLVAFAVIWTVYGCYDKALITIEKGRDCDPYNAGYTLLKAIVLRLSGRLLEAINWLESVDKDFVKLLEPSRDKKGSIMGNLTIEQTRTELVKQWYLIRYDIAVRFMTERRYEDAINILRSSKLRQLYPETYLLMGDCMSRLENSEAALGMYMNCLKKSKELKSWNIDSRKNVLLLKRISDILNEKCNEAIEDNRADDAINIADDVLRLFDDSRLKNYRILGQNRGEALIRKARAEYKRDGVTKNSDCCRSAATGLKLTRGVDDSGLYKLLFHDATTEIVIDRFGSKNNLPNSLKLLMQYS